MTFWSPRVDEFCWTKILTLIKTKRNRKWKIPQTVFDRQTLCVSSYKNRKFKVKLWWVGARKRKKWAFFVPFILSEGHFFNICVLSQCVVYWIHFQNIHTFPYQKTLFCTLLLLVFKTIESLQCILKWSDTFFSRFQGVMLSWPHSNFSSKLKSFWYLWYNNFILIVF